MVTPDAMTSSFEDDSVSLTFPSSASMLSDPSPLIDQGDHLLLSEDASRFQEMGVVATRKNCFRETYKIIMWCLCFASYFNLLVCWSNFLFFLLGLGGSNLAEQGEG